MSKAIGEFVGGVIVFCLMIVILAACVASTIRILEWLF